MEVNWEDEDGYEFTPGSSPTELYAATAGIVDRIEQELRTLTAKPLRAVIFSVLDNEGNVCLFQCGGVEDVLGILRVAAGQAVQQAGGGEERYDDEE